MKDSKKYFHSETIKRISRLELRSKYIVEGFLSGMHRSPFFGQSIEFRQHRNYVFGDDLRHVDWKVWARQDRLYVKQFEEDTNLTCHLIVDASESMSVGSGPFSKYEYAATLAACLSYLVIRQKDRVGCTVLSNEQDEILTPGSRRAQLSGIATLLEKGASHQTAPLPRLAEDLGATLARLAGQYEKRALVVILSDFFADLDSLKEGLSRLRGRGHDVLAIQILDHEEIRFTFSGPTQFEGLEQSGELRCNPAALRDAYLEALDEFQHNLRHLCMTTASDYEMVSTEDRYDVVLAKLIHRRMADQRK